MLNYLTTPDLIFSDADNVIRDAIWISVERMTQLTNDAEHFAEDPKLVIEILVPGETNERRNVATGQELKSGCKADFSRFIYS